MSPEGGRAWGAVLGRPIREMVYFLYNRLVTVRNC